ncbi:MAG: AraC family transcriptional regulator [Gemmatimonadota bacterium]
MGFTLPRHAHAEAAVALATRGTWAATLGGRDVRLEPGQARVLPQGDPHREGVGALGAECLLIEPTDVLRERAERSGIDWDSRAQAVDSRLRSLGDRLRTELASCDRFRTLAIEAHCLDLLACFGRALHPRAGPASQPWLRKARQALEDAPTDWTVGKLAVECGVTPEHLSRSFRRAYGDTVAGYLRAMRLRKAAELLRNEPQLSISIVAHRSGFSDQSHLARLFRQRFGVTPSEFRRHSTH